MKKSTKRDKSASEAPAGCSSEAGSGARSRAEDLPTHTSPHGADVPEAKGRVPLDELKDYLETKAAKHETLRDSYAEASWSHHRDHNEKRAADFRLWLTALAELRGAPRPQSECSGAQASCRHCGQGLAEDGVCENLECNPWLDDAEAESERAGLRNGSC